MAYTKKDWNTGDVIDEASMDNIENGIEANDTKNTEQDGKIAENASKNTEQDSKISALEGKTGEATASKAGLMSAADKKKLDGIEASANKYTLTAATTSVLGGVKQAAAVSDAAAAPTQEEYNGLLESLRAAGILAQS